jgi:hypothetical protein
MTDESLGQLVLRSMTDPELFGPHFQPAESWQAWQTVVKVLFGVPLTNDELPLFRKATGRSQSFAGPLSEAWLLVGRRSGKSRTLSLIATALACFRDYTPFLAPGERAVVAVLAADRDQAQTIFGYVRALLTQTAMLAPLVERETADEITLSNRVVIGIYTSSYRSIRGRTLAAALCDEAAFWRSDDSRNPAEAVIRALRPSLSTIPGAPLLLASSVYSKSGTVYEAYAKHWGRDSSPVLCWKVDTQTMNPSFRSEIIAEAFASDSVDAASEYGSIFRSDVSAFLADLDIDAAIVRDRRSLPMSLQYRYFAFVDMSGGRNDAAAIAVAHQEQPGRIVIDRVDTVAAPFNPEEVIARFATLLSSYGLNRVTGDSYSAEFVVAAHARRGIGYIGAELSKSDIYAEVLPLFTAQLVELVDVPQLEGQLRQLERRPRTSGREIIDHPRGGNDDLANAVAGALWLASRQSIGAHDDSAHSSITHALRDHDPYAEAPAIRPSPRHLPAGFGGSAYSGTYSSAIRDHDIF